MDECEKGQPVCFGGCSPLSGQTDRNPAKLPNENFGAKQDHLDGTSGLPVGLHNKIFRTEQTHYYFNRVSVFFEGKNNFFINKIICSKIKFLKRFETLED